MISTLDDIGSKRTNHKFGYFGEVCQSHILILSKIPFIDKTGEKVFGYKCKLRLSVALPYLVDLSINKLKTKLNNLFYRMILNTKRIHNSF